MSSSQGNVSTNSKKRPADNEKSIIGYVHNLSPVKKNRQKTMKYSTFTLQTSQTEVREALIYSEQKRPLFEQSQESRTPIKIKDYAFTEDNQKIVVNDKTHVGAPQQCEYAFQYAEITPSHPELVSIFQVLNNLNEWDTTTVHGRITKKMETRTVGSGRNKLALCEAVLADETAFISIDLWENHIASVQQGEVYTFLSVQLRMWAGKKKLSTTLRTTIKHDAQDKNMVITTSALEEEEDQEHEVITAKIIEFHALEKFVKFYKCPKCHKRVYQGTSTKLAKCHKCGIIKIDNCNFGISTTVSLKTEMAETISLHMGDEVLAKILQHDVNHMDEDSLAEELLFLENVTLTYISHSMLVKDIVLE